mmetsp:Transcript_82521/g.255049  ORF Transcript_82521/g.255049 Transcript_82521/m.255049 type:complete len:264 (+) Transcript_82521:301-1092(+)
MLRALGAQRCRRARGRRRRPCSPLQSRPRQPPRSRRPPRRGPRHCYWRWRWRRHARPRPPSLPPQGRRHPWSVRHHERRPRHPTSRCCSLRWQQRLRRRLCPRRRCQSQRPLCPWNQSRCPLPWSRCHRRRPRQWPVRFHRRQRLPCPWSRSRCRRPWSRRRCCKGPPPMQKRRPRPRRLHGRPRSPRLQPRGRGCEGGGGRRGKRSSNPRRQKLTGSRRPLRQLFPPPRRRRAGTGPLAPASGSAPSAWMHRWRRSLCPAAT